MNVFIKIIKKHPVLSVIIALLVIYLGISIKQHKGPSVRVETDAPASDFVVRCTWSSAGFLHGGGHIIATRIAVINSNETYDCGYSFWAGVQGASSNVGVRHPIYTGQEGKSYNVIDGVRVAKLITLLQKIDEHKAKFKRGYWNNYKSPDQHYLKHFPVCGVDPKYFSDYLKVKKIDIDRFKERYHEPWISCLNQRYAVLKEVDPYTYKRIIKPKERMEKMWKASENRR